MGNFLADFYSVNGLVLESRKRREHLSEEDILRNKAIMESLSKGGNLIEQNFEVTLHLAWVFYCSDRKVFHTSKSINTPQSVSHFVTLLPKSNLFLVVK